MNKYHKLALRWAARYGSIYRSQELDFINDHLIALPKERWRDIDADGEYGHGRTVPYSICEYLWDKGYIAPDTDSRHEHKFVLTAFGLGYCINNRIIKKVK